MSSAFASRPYVCITVGGFWYLAGTPAFQLGPRRKGIEYVGFVPRWFPSWRFPRHVFESPQRYLVTYFNGVNVLQVPRTNIMMANFVQSKGSESQIRLRQDGYSLVLEFLDSDFPGAMLG